MLIGLIFKDQWMNLHLKLPEIEGNCLKDRYLSAHEIEKINKKKREDNIFKRR